MKVPGTWAKKLISNLSWQPFWLYLMSACTLFNLSDFIKWGPRQKAFGDMDVFLKTLYLMCCSSIRIFTVTLSINLSALEDMCIFKMLNITFTAVLTTFQNFNANCKDKLCNKGSQEKETGRHCKSNKDTI